MLERSTGIEVGGEAANGAASRRKIQPTDATTRKCIRILKYYSSYDLNDDGWTIFRFGRKEVIAHNNPDAEQRKIVNSRIWPYWVSRHSTT